MRAVPESTFRAIFLLMLIAFGAILYSNSSGHAYHLDSIHTILNNPAVRSLGEIPHYFVEPRTFSVLNLNLDYRPVLQTSYAVNYAASGYRMAGWHWTQVGVHIWCAFFLYLFGFELFRRQQHPEHYCRLVAALAALLFLVQPTNSGVVNYLAARSSELTAAFLLPAFWLFGRGRTGWSVVLFLFALFTKVEAVAALAVFFGLALLERGDFKRSVRACLPSLGAVVFYMIARHMAMRGIDLAGNASGGVATPYSYLCTQTTTWWNYIYMWFCPLNLVADNAAYPVYPGVLSPPVMLALTGWGAIAVLLIRSAKSSPHLVFLAFSGLALISPTSSIVPLAEMMNEHRPYLPAALVSLISVDVLVRFYLSLGTRLRVMLILCVLSWLGCLAQLTYQRNLVFLTDRSYWLDVVTKAPSPRAYNNYGLTFLQAGQFVQAKEQFELAVKCGPSYDLAYVNLAIANTKLGNLAAAAQNYNQAVAVDLGSGEAYLWRAKFLLDQGDYKQAEADLLKAQSVSINSYSIKASLARTYAGLGDASRSIECALQAGRLDFAQFSVDIVQIAGPYFSTQEQAKKGLEFFAALEKEWPNVWWIELNQANLATKLGKTELAKEHQQRSDKLRGQ
jgi:Tfp pilus assembly protein PilF